MILTRSILAAAALLALCGAADAQQGCDQVASYDASTNGATKLVSGSTKLTIVICGFAVTSGSATNMSLVSGTGTNCGTGQAQITPSFNVAVGTPLVDSSPSYRGLSVAAGLDLCIKSIAAAPIQALIYYNQF